MLKEVYRTEETLVLVPVSEDWEQVAKCTQVHGLALEASPFASEGLDRPGLPVASLRSPAAPSAGDSAESAVSAAKGTDT